MMDQVRRWMNPAHMHTPDCEHQQAHKVRDVKPAPKVQNRRELNGLEKSCLNASMALLAQATELMEQGGMHESFRIGAIASYEKMLDAVMYGYPAACFDGWENEWEQKRHGG